MLKTLSLSHVNYRHRLGIVHRCIGFIKKQQGLSDDSFDAFLEALKHFKDTVGDKSHYVAQMCSNLGAYHIAKKEYETARCVCNWNVAIFLFLPLSSDPAKPPRPSPPLLPSLAFFIFLPEK
jgi:hypothetical protein